MGRQTELRRTAGRARRLAAAAALIAASSLTGSVAIAQATTYGSPVAVGSGYDNPYGVSVDASGDVFLAAESNAITEIAPDGSTTYVGSDLNNPTGSAVDSRGDVFVADYDNSRIVEFTPGPDGKYADGTETAIGSGFAHPRTVAVDTHGNVFVADEYNSRIVELSPGADGSYTDGTETQTTIASGITYPAGVAVDAAGDVFFADAGTVDPGVGVTPGTGSVKELVPGADGSYTDGSQSESTIITGLNSPYGVAVDKWGDVFVADTYDQKVMEAIPGADGKYSDGTVGEFGSGFKYPYAVAVDSTGDVFVADTDHDVVDEYPVVIPVPVNTKPPTVSGTLLYGSKLTASSGAWTSSSSLSHAYQWETCSGSTAGTCTPISGANHSTLVLGKPELGESVAVKVTATNQEGGSASATSAVRGLVTAPAPVATTTPSVTGTVQDGQTLTAHRSTWSDPAPMTYAYAWYTCADQTGTSCQLLAGQTSYTLKLTSADVGSYIEVKMTADAGGTTAGNTAQTTSAVGDPASPANTTAPKISGSTNLGAVDSTTNGTWKSPDQLTYTYQWLRCTGSTVSSCTTIAGATLNHHTRSSADTGKTLAVTVTASDQEGQTTATTVLQP